MTVRVKVEVKVMNVTSKVTEVLVKMMGTCRWWEGGGQG